MQNLPAMRVVDGAGDFLHITRRLPRSQGVLAREVRQALARDKVHRVEVLAVHLADLVDGHDVGVIKLGGGTGLDMEAADFVRAREPLAPDHLQRHDAVERPLPRLEDHAHAAARDLAEQFVIAKGLARARHEFRVSPLNALGNRQANCRRRCRARAARRPAAEALRTHPVRQPLGPLAITHRTFVDRIHDPEFSRCRSRRPSREGYQNELTRGQHWRAAGRG